MSPDFVSLGLKEDVKVMKITSCFKNAGVYKLYTPKEPGEYKIVFYKNIEYLGSGCRFVATVLCLSLSLSLSISLSLSSLSVCVCLAHSLFVSSRFQQWTAPSNSL